MEKEENDPMRPSKCRVEKADIFIVKEIQNVVSIQFRDQFFEHIGNLDARNFVFRQLNQIKQSDSVRALILNFSLETADKAHYKNFFLDEARTKRKLGIYRYGNVINQLIMTIIGLGKIVIFICHGELISLFLNLGLACHYRIASATTVFHNAYLELGMLPIGGGPFFLGRLLGTPKALEILLLNDQITADRAHQLGLVERVVPPADLEKTALEIAQRFALYPPRSLKGLIRLLNYSRRDLDEYLRFENHEFISILEQTAFADRGAA